MSKKCIFRITTSAICIALHTLTIVMALANESKEKHEVCFVEPNV